MNVQLINHLLYREELANERSSRVALEEELRALKEKNRESVQYAQSSAEVVNTTRKDLDRLIAALSERKEKRKRKKERKERREKERNGGGGEAQEEAVQRKGFYQVEAESTDNLLEDIEQTKQLLAKLEQSRMI